MNGDFTGFFEALGRPVVYHPSLAKLLGSKNAAILLEQLIYWTPRSKDPDGWVYKKPDEWEEETGLSYEEQRSARELLRARGVWEERNARLEHRLYFRVIRAALNSMWAGGAVGKFPIGERGIPQRRNGKFPTGEMGNSLSAGKEIPNPVVPEITAESTRTLRAQQPHASQPQSQSRPKQWQEHRRPAGRRQDFHPTPVLQERDLEIHPIRYLLTRFDLAFQVKTTERHPPFTGKEAKTAENLIKHYGVARAAEMVDEFFALASDDDFVRQAGLTFNIFKVSLGKIISRKAGAALLRAPGINLGTYVPR